MFFAAEKCASGIHVCHAKNRNVTSKNALIFAKPHEKAATKKCFPLRLWSSRIGS
jgi:hypothetical protein